jgi:hypothetical protein
VPVVTDEVPKLFAEMRGAKEEDRLPERIKSSSETGQ